MNNEEKQIKLTKTERGLIYACLFRIAEGVSEKHLKYFNRRNGKFLKINPEKIMELAERLK